MLVWCTGHRGHRCDQLPFDSITGLSITYAVQPGSLSALAHLAPGLRRLTLAWTDLTDEALPHLAVLRHLTWWQSFGNRFSDAGVYSNSPHWRSSTISTSNGYTPTCTDYGRGGA